MLLESRVIVCGVTLERPLKPEAPPTFPTINLALSLTFKPFREASYHVPHIVPPRLHSAHSGLGPHVFRVLRLGPPASGTSKYHTLRGGHSDGTSV